jgi:hypothetical protein
LADAPAGRDAAQQHNSTTRPAGIPGIFGLTSCMPIIWTVPF